MSLPTLPVRRALLSVWDKTGVVELARSLHAHLQPPACPFVAGRCLDAEAKASGYAGQESVSAEFLQMHLCAVRRMQILHG